MDTGGVQQTQESTREPGCRKPQNQEFGEIVPEQGENNVDRQEQDSSEQPSAQSAKESTTTSTSEGSSHPNIQARNPTSRKPINLSREEENNLSEYIALGMSITEARESYQKEMEMAELKLRIRENQRNSLRGAIRNETNTKIGPTTSYRGGGRGGLSFN